MKIYIDSSDIKEIKEINKTKLVDGITTNPSLIAKQNKDIKQFSKKYVRKSRVLSVMMTRKDSNRGPIDYI